MAAPSSRTSQPCVLSAKLSRLASPAARSWADFVHVRPPSSVLNTSVVLTADALSCADPVTAR